MALDTIMEIESIIKAVKQKIITRDEGSSLIIDVLLDKAPHPMEAD